MRGITLFIYYNNITRVIYYNNIARVISLGKYLCSLAASGKEGKSSARN